MRRCKTIDLDVPADTEIVVEGEILPGIRRPEGPFGESHGPAYGGGTTGTAWPNAQLMAGAVSYGICISAEEGIPDSILTLDSNRGSVNEEVYGSLNQLNGPIAMNYVNEDWKMGVPSAALGATEPNFAHHRRSGNLAPTDGSVQTSIKASALQQQMNLKTAVASAAPPVAVMEKHRADGWRAKGGGLEVLISRSGRGVDRPGASRDSKSAPKSAPNAPPQSTAPQCSSARSETGSRPSIAAAPVPPPRACWSGAA